MTTAGSQDADPGSLLTDAAEMLYRQVHPSWVQDGQPTSQAFVPTNKDSGKLSVYRGSLTTPQGSFTHYTAVLGYKSAGTWGFTGGEAGDAGLSCHAEPLPDNQAHGFVDFRRLSNKDAKSKGKLLLAAARARGCLYAPD